jgi:1,4-alpha-glucan branching enzyme
MRSVHIFIFSFLVIILSNISLVSQNAIVGTGFSSGWGGGSCPTTTADFNFLSSSLGGSFGKTVSPNGTGNQFFRFGIGWDNTTDQRTVNIGSDLAINAGVEYTLNTACTTSGAMYINVPNVNNRYVFKTKNAGTNPTGKFIVFALQAEASTVLQVLQSPNTSGVAATQIVTISSIMDKQLPIGQGAYIRYTTNGWTSSTVLPMNGIGQLYQAAIPAQVAGTIVNYYIFTSGSSLSISGDNADFYAINANTNNGANYGYTVLSGSPQVGISPQFPSDLQTVTVSINTQGTPLEGSSKVYFHAGVSTIQNTPMNFQYVKGNWGQDDGVGLMVQDGTNPHLWTTTISTLRSYFGAPIDKDIHGLNFLFRNASGTAKVDNLGANYHYAADAGTYFIITQPTMSSIAIQSGSNTVIMATSTTAPNQWVLKDSTNNTIITTTTGSQNFVYTLSYPDGNARKYKLSAIYTSGQKFKMFDVIGYLPVVIAPRPSGMKPGINYDHSDPTKATLVLHAPTFTQFKKGTGIVSGTSNTTAKNVVFVVGDFNNWTPTEAYKMQRDRDGWDGSTDADGDNDRGDYWWITLTGLVPGQAYVFQYLIDGHLQVADPYATKISDFDDSQIPTDIYPNLLTYRPQAIDRASVLQTADAPFSFTAPSFAAPDKKDLHIYELHFRDFTEEGSYLAGVDRLDYLKGLGVNAIHVMPVSEFEGNSSWGYNPNFYFATDKAYGPAADLKRFVDECHKRQILVFNDLVLNHAFYSNVMARMYWNTSLNRPAEENPWFNAEHKMVRNPAGHWGADINHESEHTQKMVDSILGYWYAQFKFDGTRFDFTKGFGQTDPNSFPVGDDWASAYNQDRIDLLKRMVDRVSLYYPGKISIFEHLADATEDKVLADHGILMWSGVGHHNALKNMVLGYNADNPNIFSSGIYNASSRNFSQAHWISYGESHDEERLGYELMQFYNGARTTATMIDRLKIGYGFNLFMPGPRMLWQFGELGYDYSIEFNGRTGEKPVRWDYYEEAKRKELYRLISRIFKARTKVNLYSTSPDYGNIGAGAGNITIPRVMRLSSSTNQHAIIVANLDPAAAHDVIPNFDITGDWYRYNGTLDESLYAVNSTNQNGTYLLNPSEMIVFTSFKIDDCTDVRTTADSGENSLRDAIDCAPNNGKVTIEYPLYNDSITLAAPILIDKNLTISGFASQNILVKGTTLTEPVLSIGAGVTVNIEGLKLTCSTGNVNGRCLVNAGTVRLGNVTLIDQPSNVLGNTILNQGTLTITRDVLIKK